MPNMRGTALVALAVAMQSTTTSGQIQTGPPPPTPPPTTLSPSTSPTTTPTSSPSTSPTAAPTSSPSTSPTTGSPVTASPSSSPTTGSPTTLSPTSSPTTVAPTSSPTTVAPTVSPTVVPSGVPTYRPSMQPSSQPSYHPSLMPSSSPSEQPSSQPSYHPSLMPSSVPSEKPSLMPSASPSLMPSSVPSEKPSLMPSSSPSEQPSGQPSSIPSLMPSSIPSEQPSSGPSETPSANPSQGCENIRDGCGWGIFNPWTCQCDCPVGICLDNNGYCLNPCQETIDVNPWSGCAPGWDCPWHPSEDGGHCVSDFHIPNQFEIYRHAWECCQEHYGGSPQCVIDSKTPGIGYIATSNEFPDTTNFYAPVEAEYLWQSERGQPEMWYPDLYGKQNCVHGSNYEHWMNENAEIRDQYLHGTAENCCEKWYPTKGASCPEPATSEITAVNPEAEDEAYAGRLRPYYFPDFSANSCGYGLNYPAWMGINGYERSYLFTDGATCCDRHFKGSATGSCPYETVYDPGYYWEKYQNDYYNENPMPVIHNFTYYPQMEAGTCVNGTDFPDWMNSDTAFRQRYIFKNDLEGCCKEWFSAYGVNNCVNKVIQGLYDPYVPCDENRPTANCNTTPAYTNYTEHKKNMWYADLDGYTCKNDGDMPDFMLKDEYSPFYLFNAREQCCAAFGYDNC